MRETVVHATCFFIAPDPQCKVVTMDTISIDPEILPPRLLRTELPTIVREMCEDAHQISVWLAIRWLNAGRLTHREIAARAKCNVKTVSAAVAKLVSNNLLEIVRYDDLPKNLRHADGHKHAQQNGTPIYRIPLWIEKENATFTLAFIAQVRAHTPSAPTSTAQTAFDGLDPVPDPFSDRTARTGHVTAPSSDPKTDRGKAEIDSGDAPMPPKTPDPKTDRTVALRSENGSAPDPKTDRLNNTIQNNTRRTIQDDPQAPPGIDSCTGQPFVVVASNPYEVWASIRSERPEKRAWEHQELADIAAALDGDYAVRHTHAGAGHYWLRRAISEAHQSDEELGTSPPKRAIGFIRKITQRWITTGDYGSKTETFVSGQRQRTAKKDSASPPAPPAPPSVPVTSDVETAVGQQLRLTTQQLRQIAQAHPEKPLTLAWVMAWATFLHGLDPDITRPVGVLFNTMKRQFLPPLDPTRQPPAPAPLPGPYANVWTQFMAAVDPSITPQDRAMWVAPCAVLDISENAVVVGAPNVFVREELQSAYTSRFDTTFAQVLGRPITTEFVIREWASATTP